MSQEYMAGEVVSRGGSAEPTPQFDLQSGAEESFVNHTAQQLSNRQKSATVDQVGGSSNAVGEQTLISKQQELNQAAKRGDLLAVDRLEQECFQLASQLVGGVNAPAPKSQEERQKEEPVSTADSLKSEYGEQQVNDTLTWAGSALSPEVAEALNEGLSGDGADAHVTFSAIQHLQKNPDYIGASDQNIAFDPSVSNQLQEDYGKHGETLAAINAAMCAGQCSRAKAIQMVMADPKLAQVAFSAAKAGLIKLAV